MLVRTVIMYYWHYYVLLSGLGVSDIYTYTVYEILASMRDYHQIQTGCTGDNDANADANIQTSGFVHHMSGRHIYK